MANERDLSSGMFTAITAAIVRPVLMYKMETAVGPIYIWSGLGDLVWNGMTFRGVGLLGSVEAIQETIDQSANSVKVALAGIPNDMLSISLNSVQNRYRATLWFGCFDSNLTLIVDPYQIFQGITDVPEIVEGEDTCKIIITLESTWADLNRAKVQYYTTEDQKIIDPTDKGFDFVPGLQNASIIFA